MRSYFFLHGNDSWECYGYLIRRSCFVYLTLAEVLTECSTTLAGNERAKLELERFISDVAEFMMMRSAQLILLEP